MTYSNAYLLMYILHLQRLLQKKIIPPLWLRWWFLIACQTGISCAIEPLTWIFGLICLENDNETFFFFFLVLRFGHVTGWVNAYPQSAWHEQYLHSDPQPPRVPVKHLLQHVAALFADCEIYSNGISELIPQFWRSVLMQNMQWIKFVLISFAAAINAVFLYSIRFFIGHTFLQILHR